MPLKGHFTGGFARGALGVWQAAQEAKSLRERLDIEKRIADSRSKLFDAQIEDLQRRAQSGEGLRALLTRTQPVLEKMPEDIESFVQSGSRLRPEFPSFRQEPRPSTTQERAEAIAPGFPKEAAEMIGQEQARAAMFEHLERRRRGATTGPSPAGPALPSGIGVPPEPPAPTAVGPPLAMNLLSAPAFFADMPRELWTTNYSATGDVSFTIRDDPESYTAHYETLPAGPGMSQKWEIVSGSRRGPVHRAPFGPPMPNETLQRAQVMLQGIYELAPSTALFDRSAPILAAILSADKDAQPGLLKRFETKLKTAVSDIARGGQQAGALGPEPLGSEPLSTALEEARQAREAEQRRMEQMRRAEAPLQGAEKTRFEILQSAERSAQLVVELFDPRFVGKGFQAFREAFHKQAEVARRGQYASGAIFGALREWLGTGSPEEIQFRRALADLQDQVLRARSGAQIREEEFARLTAFIGRLTDEPATFTPSMQRFLGEITQQIEDLLDVATLTPAELREKRKQRRSGPSKPEQPGAPTAKPAAPAAVTAPSVSEEERDFTPQVVGEGEDPTSRMMDRAAALVAPRRWMDVDNATRQKIWRRIRREFGIPEQP